MWGIFAKAQEGEQLTDWGALGAANLQTKFNSISDSDCLPGMHRGFCGRPNLKSRLRKRENSAFKICLRSLQASVRRDKTSAISKCKLMECATPNARGWRSLRWKLKRLNSTAKILKINAADAKNRLQTALRALREAAHGNKMSRCDWRTCAPPIPRDFLICPRKIAAFSTPKI